LNTASAVTAFVSPEATAVALFNDNETAVPFVLAATSASPETAETLF
jgi:hypothetical protein